MFNTEIYTDLNKYVDNGKGKVTYTGILLSSKLNQKNGQDYKLIDAVDIDWNGAWIETMEDTYLYTTEDLINVINQLNRSNELSAIQREIDKIWKQINEITASYVTYSYLDEHLNEFWQRKLTFGTYIGYDEETYTVYAYDLPTYDFLAQYYTSRLTFDEYKEHIKQNYYDKGDTKRVAYTEAYDAILRVIAGADQKFDTLKEVADWILEQNVWVEAPLEEVLEALAKWKESQNDDDWPKDTYFIYDEETETYTPINDPNLIDETGATQYWKQENYLVELKRLIVRVNALDTRVGDKVLTNEELELYTYSGLFADVYELQKEDVRINEHLDQIDRDLDETKDIANTAYNMGYNAYVMAYTAYEIAYTALETSFESIEKANLAYDMAYTAIVRVGEETIPMEYVAIDFENLAEYISEGREILYFDEEHQTYFSAEEPYDENIQYYYLQEYVEGTGLTRRVEKVEVKAQTALDTANVALVSSYESLYHLFVNNEDSSYVKLGLHPSEFDGDRNRILSITTSEASIDRHTGEVFDNGLVNLSTAFDIYSYASSWMMLFVDEDIEFPNQYPDEIEEPEDPEYPKEEQEESENDNNE